MSYPADRLSAPGWGNIDVGMGFFAYTFIYDISSRDNLPPDSYSDLISKLALSISKAYSMACLWVRVDAPAAWFPLEIRRGLDSSALPVAITGRDSELVLADFNFRPSLTRRPLPSPALVRNEESSLAPSELACLRVLARITQGLTPEIASLSGFGFLAARNALQVLEQHRLIRQLPPVHAHARSASSWKIMRLGLSTALRTWNVPAGVQFSSRAEAAHGESLRHRLTARLWPAWLKMHLGASGEIWAGWTEARLRGVHATPDALAWGRAADREALFWLEVESGKRSTERVAQKIRRSFQSATRYAMERKLNLVFAVLAQPWVQQAVRSAVTDVEPQLAVILGDWKAFGTLPLIQWGRVRASQD
jgi:hypothetical protein